MSKRIDINKAGLDELSSLIGVGKAKAEAILDARKALGGFKDVKDLANVAGIGRSILELNQGQITCGKAPKDGPGSSTETNAFRDRGDSSNIPPGNEGRSLRERSNVVPSAKAVTRTSYPPKLSSGSGTQRTENDGVEADNGKQLIHRYSQGSKILSEAAKSPNAGNTMKLRSNSGASSSKSSSDKVARTQRKSLSDCTERNPSDCCVLPSNRSRSSGDADIRSPAFPRTQGQAQKQSRANISKLSCKLVADPCPVASSNMEPDVVERRALRRRDTSSERENSSGQGMALRSRSVTQSVCVSDKGVMKRKSEGGGSKDGSPEKKPCRNEASDSEEAAPSGSRAVVGTTEKATHPFYRKGRIPSKANPPPELANWIKTFTHWSHAERLMALDQLVEQCEPTQVRHVMQVIEPQFQRDFISLLPKELALHVLSFLSARDLCRAAQTCRYWRVLAEDNLLWREKCLEEDIKESFVDENQQCPRAYTNSPSAIKKSPWKAAFLRQQQIEYNWREGSVRPAKVLKGHDDHVITCLEFCGDKVVSGSDDNTLKVWSAITGECLQTLVGHTGGVWSSQMRDDIVISGSTDRTLKVWNAETGECEHTLVGHTSTVRCMCLHKNKVVSGSRDATLRLWDVEKGECLHVLVGHLAAVRCVQYDGRRVVSGAYDTMLKIWDPETETCLHTLSGHTNRVYSLQFDGCHIISGSLDTSIRVWDVETGQCLHTLIGHQSLTSGMELKDNILVSGNADSTVKVWDIKTGTCLQTLQGVFKHQSAVTCLQFNKKFVITASDDGTVKMWSLRTGCFLRNLVSLESGGRGGVVWRIRSSNTKLVCAVGSRNGTEETRLLVLNFDVEDAGSSSSPSSGAGCTQQTVPWRRMSSLSIEGGDREGEDMVHQPRSPGLNGGG